MRARILAVDDWPTCTEHVAQILAQDGCVVDTARDGLAALAKVAENGPYDVFVSGLIMPRMNGQALYDELAGLNPRLSQRFVFLTGLRGFTPPPGVPCLRKPPRPDDLRKVVKHLLAIRRPALFVSAS
jgi:CheY-like chemotaxis protein